jgi:glutaminyl-peptide cyclotransferase
MQGFSIDNWQRMFSMMCNLAFHQGQCPITPLTSSIPFLDMKPKIISKLRKPTTYGSFQLLQTIPHDKDAFTQGLSVVHLAATNNETTIVAMEGTGLYGSSELRYLDMETGSVIQRYQLGDNLFGEGITQFNYKYPVVQNDKNIIPNQQLHRQLLLQITWQNSTAFVYDIFQNRKLLEGDDSVVQLAPPIFNFTYKTTNNNEGWGITYRGDQHVFYVTDGSSNIHTWCAHTFQELRVQQVMHKEEQPHQDENGIISDEYKFTPIFNLNEIEWDPVTQTILANVWGKDYIVRIFPDTGHVATVYDLKYLYTNRTDTANVLNGIALTSNFEPMENNEIWVTGKLWPHMYRIKLVD